MLISFPNAFGTAAQNMAVDATLLETLPANRALFRHYGWTEPSITIGYTQKLTNISTLVAPDCTIVVALQVVAWSTPQRLDLRADLWISTCAAATHR